MSHDDTASAIREFHAHVYFSVATRSSAIALRDRLAGLAGGRLVFHSIADEPRGPHVLPMFGVDIPRADLPDVLGFLMLNHGPHSVLIHPVTGDELMDHTHHALWLGRREPLDLGRLR
jgi:DOPA 4,5-dioxygenase